MGRQLRKARRSAVIAFVHVERPVDLDLQRVAMLAGAPVKASREAPGIGRVDPDLEAAFREEPAGCRDDPRSASRAETVL